MIENPVPAPAKTELRPVVAVSLAMALVAVAMGAAWFVTRDQGHAASVSSTTTATTPATTATTAAPDVDADSLESVVADLSAFVEDQRDLQFKHPVAVELAGDAEFDRRLLDDFQAEDEADIRDTEAIFRALGFIDADVDLVAELKGVLSAGVVGFYDPETDELVVRGVEATPYARQTMAHELTHALDDQHFELFRPDLDQADDETGFAFTSLAEGDATVVGDAYRDSLSQDEQDQLDAEESALGGETDFSQFPPILLSLIGAPYELGPQLIHAIVADGGEGAIDQAFEDPPVSSEQILDPNLYLGDEQPLDVARPAADGERFDQGTFGQYLLLLLLSDGGVDDEVARQAAIGWGGDQYVAWHDGDQTCLRAAFQGDTPDDTDELETALQTWAEARDGATVERNADDQAVLTSCG